jgi:[ribosomal protein S5]-alanine N-acetyltransferase
MLTPVSAEPLELPEGRLTDGVIAMRPARVEDAPDLARGVKDPAIVRFAAVPWIDDTEGELADRIANVWPQAALEGRAMQLAICDDHTDTILGYSPFFGVNRRNGRCEIGFFLFPQARGRGAAARAVQLLVRWAFDDLGLSRVQATTDVENGAAQRTLENAGFQREGVLREYYPLPTGGRFDCVMYSRLASD